MAIKTCVSLYSLQYEYLNHRMSLEDIFKFLHDNGVDGAEVLPDQMIKGSPEASDETIAEWHRLCEKYNVKPVIADIFINTNMYRNRDLTKKECVKLLEKEIIQASKLGIHLVRLISFTPAYCIEPLLPTCIKYDVRMAVEIHAGLGFDQPKTQEYIKVMKKLKSPYVGLVIDTGIFCKRPPKVFEDYCKAFGADDAMLEAGRRCWDNDGDGRNIRLRNTTPAGVKGEFIPEVAKVLKEHPTEGNFMYANLVDGYEWTPYSVLDEYLPYLFHFHFKLFSMGPDGEYSMDFKEILQYLHDHGYNGYVSTEYEGNRWTLPGLPTTEKEEVLKHQKFIKKCIKEIEG